MYYISRCQYQCYLDNPFGGGGGVGGVVASMSGLVLCGVVEVVGSNLSRGELFTASIG